MSLQKQPCFTLTARDAGHLTLLSEQGDAAHVFVLEPDIVRILVLPRRRLNHSKTFAIAPGAEDVAPDGRDRFDLAGFSLPQFFLETGRPRHSSHRNCSDPPRYSARRILLFLGVAVGDRMAQRRP